jgi:NAD(P)H-hydrate epimerase
MRQWDEATQALGIPALLLMENAGFAAARLLASLRPVAGARIWCLMGSGNNGGDAACLARHVKDMGASPLMVLAKPPESLAPTAAEHFAMAKACGVEHVRLADLPSEPLPDVLVDGLLGTGFSGELRPDLREIVDRVNGLAPGRFVFALDVPSGLDADRGVPCPVAVRADATVCFGAGRFGVCLPEARPYVGTVHVASIGIPAGLASTLPCSGLLLDARALRLAPAMLADGHKHAFGHVAILGGGEGMHGAALLAARGALRAGAGLVTVAAPSPAFSPSLPETMTCALRGTPMPEAWPEDPPPHLLRLLSRCRAMVAGPGMGHEAGPLLRRLLDLPHRPPAVIDADALRLLGMDRELFGRLTEDDILTPHPGEAEALLGESIKDRGACLEALVSLSRASVVLKGAGTRVGRRGSPTLLSPYDVPQLAVAGSGDVLAGCCGALLAAGLPGLHAAALGVCLHALAGKRLRQDFPARGNTASEVADTLPAVRTPPPPGDPGRLPWPN